MEAVPSPKSSTDKEGLLSCWGCLKLKLPWKRRNTRHKYYTTITPRHVRSKSMGAGFRYDPLSYAQNFDEGWDNDEDEELPRRGFAGRFVAPLSKPLEDE